MTARRQPLATAQEVAVYLNKPIATLYVWRTRKKGPPASKVGRTLRYRWDDVDAWVEQQSGVAA
jgi:excisionase family DNA binding protein